MKLACVAILLCFGALAQAASNTIPSPGVLARVEIGTFSEPPRFAVHAILQDQEGHDYLLAHTSEDALAASKRSFRVLARGVAPQECVLATPVLPGAIERAGGRYEVLHDDGLRWLLRADAAEVEALSELGFSVQRLSADPMVWPEVRGVSKDDPRPQEFTPNPLVGAMVEAVQETNLHTMVSRISGRQPVIAAGKPQYILTRRTTSGFRLQNALEMAFSRFQALGLRPAYHNWVNGGLSNQNVYATLTGSSNSSQIVLVCAHIDDMPNGSYAPGADDNASGTAAVLTAAGIFSQYRFERTLRFVLFTGEEDGLLGSASYASAVRGAGHDIVAVLNMDMIGWDSGKPSTFQLHTRVTSSPGYTNDLAIASTFTNAVAAYGLSGQITPVIRPDGLTRSDHYAFWYYGYPAIAASEDYNADFNPHYHSVNDTVDRLNMAYFSAAVRASVATAAHLAGPIGRVPSAVLEVASSDWSPASGLGASVLVVRHVPGADETAMETLDLAVTNMVPNPSARWFQLDTMPYGIELGVDSRPPQSQSVFAAELTVAGQGTAVTTSNKLRFDFISPPAPDRIYLARVKLAADTTPLQQSFLCITNLRQLEAAGGELQLPGVYAGSPGSVYGTCEIAARFLDLSPAACPLVLSGVTGTNLVFSTRAQAGTSFQDEIECSTELPGTNWLAAASFTYSTPADEAAFESGWEPVEWSVPASALPISERHYFRLRRTWLGY